MTTLVAASLWPAGPALADNGPHAGAGFGAAPDECGACHRAHTSRGARLLGQPGSTNLCLACHSGGAGANTNVVDGIYGPSALGLRGGGLTAALMDTALVGTPAAATTTSAHTANAAPGTAWGGGPITAVPDPGGSITLECVNCHDPHGNGQYRLLRKRPLEGGAPTDVTVADEAVKDYAITYDADGRRDLTYAPGTISEWCAQCHTRYLAPAGSGHTDSTDAIFTYRHFTDGLGGGCLACHVAHGTSATMGPFSGARPWPGGAWSGGSTDSRLLHLDNRGVCAGCHVTAAGVVGGCVACHDRPPATGVHGLHVQAGVSGCGSCHLFGPATHNDGQLNFADGATALHGTTACDTCHAGGPPLPCLTCHTVH